MTTLRFGMLVGLAIGAVWALTGWRGALLTTALAVVGTLVALVVEGRVDVTEYLGHSHRDRSP